MSQTVSDIIDSSANQPRGRWFIVAISVFLHTVMVILLGVFAWVSVPEYDPGFRISIAEAALNTSDLPPIGDTQEAGMAGNVMEAGAPEIEEQPIIEEPVEQAPEPEPEVVEEEVVNEPPVEVETRAEEPVVEQPREEVQQPVQEQTQPEPEPDTTVISTSMRDEEEDEPEPEPEPAGPTPQEVARELERRQAVFTAKRNTGGGTVARFVAAESDPGGQGGPALYRSVLIGRIGSIWQPSFTPRGTVRDCTVEFTIYSPPLPRDAVNQVRTARVTNIRVIKSSGDMEYDNRAVQAVRRVRQWPPLPDSYRKETLAVQCRFYLIGED